MKDRELRFRLADDAAIVYRRSSGPPIEYAVMLVVLRDGEWHTVRTFDNAHAVEEHHEHGYVGAKKQPPAVTYGPVNDAMSAAILKLRERWVDMVTKWERTR